MGLTRRSVVIGGAAAAGGCLLGCGSPDERVRGLRILPPARGGLQDIPAGDARIRFCAVGDWGRTNPTLASVVETLRTTGHARDSDFVLLLGDNFYDDGVGSAHDPRWRTQFEQGFPQDSFDLPFYAVLGNHDHLGNVAAQVEYSGQSARWRLPAFHYKATFEAAGQPLLDIFCLDTTPLHVDAKDARKQLDWLAEQLTASAARWRIVAGHHPLLSGGTSGRLGHSHKRLAKLLEQHHVPVYVAGHDHDLELLTDGRGWLQVISGSASHPRKVLWTRDSLLACDEPGYVRFTATADDLYLEYVSVPRGVCATFALSRLEALRMVAAR